MPAARKAPAPPRVRPAPEVESKPIAYELVGLGFITLGVILVLGTRLHGNVSAHLLNGLHWLVGVYGAWGVAVALIALGVLLMVRLSHITLSLSTLGTAITLLSIISLLQLRQAELWNPALFATSPGGFLGSAITSGMHYLLGEVTWVVLVAFALGGVALMTHVPLWMVMLWPFKALYLAGRWAFSPLGRWWRRKREERLAARVAALQEAELYSRNRPLEAEKPARPARKAAVIPPVSPKEEEPALPERKFPAPRLPEPLPAVVGTPSKEQPEQLTFEEQIAPVHTGRPYDLPPIELLTNTPRTAPSGKDNSQEQIQALEETLASFGIEAKVVGVERGPRVTRFEIVPPPGIRINRITNLADNLALSLAALDVRVEAPVPGKGVVGIEVPNHDLVTVDLREIIESDTCRKAKSPLTFALGRDIAGIPRVADLARMPHLLIAGATNSGKSVCINSLLCSILMRATPQQVKLLLVDPKRVELSLFQQIPHLIAPVAYDAKHAAGLLRWAIREMEQRYEMFAEKGVRNIIGFNEQSRLDGLEEVPYIVIIIDELADLMMQAAAEFEASICRIAQLARATGIHLVVATQRPSVNVITGTIKANIPSRIAFAVASQVDSRTILDMNGAERLVGQGDMLYLPVDASKPARIQGAYVSEADINRIVQFVKSQGKPFFSDEIVAIEEESLAVDGEGGGMNNEPEDELFQKSLDYIRATKYASTSMLQRKFRIGYTRAARIMDLFEERGYVGPGQGSKPREVIFAPASSVVGRPAATAPAAREDDEEDSMLSGEWRTPDDE